MQYSRASAKSYAFAHLRGVWAAAPVPFADGGEMDEAGFRANIDHWIAGLGLKGLCIGGKEAACFTMSAAERKRSCDWAVAAAAGRAQVMVACSDQNLDVVLDLARHAQAAGADYVLVEAPVLPLLQVQDETLLRYFRLIADAVDIGLVIASHSDSGYLISPRLCNRLADLETVVAVQHAGPPAMLRELTGLAKDRALICNRNEDEWLGHAQTLGWSLHLCGSAGHLMQSAVDRRVNDYVAAALSGDFETAQDISDSLDRVRAALAQSQPREKPHAHQRFWQGLLGQTGGALRPPLLQLSAREQARCREAFEFCGLL